MPEWKPNVLDVNISNYCHLVLVFNIFGPHSIVHEAVSVQDHMVALKLHNRNDFEQQPAAASSAMS